MDYSSVKIPTAFIEQIKKFIETHQELGFRTHSEFIMDASRKALLNFQQDEIEREKNQKNKN
jgi:metal-responsive CopG/Arc/MetJ family transcriptional regulator